MSYWSDADCSGVALGKDKTLGDKHAFQVFIPDYTVIWFHEFDFQVCR